MKSASLSRRLAPSAAIFLLALFPQTAPAQELRLTPDEATRIGHKVWRNECDGTVAGLTSWNPGENFASLGIGHFIWYPKGVSGPFDESFPKLLVFLQSRGVHLPEWLSPGTPCPWPSRHDFESDARSNRMTELRQMLASTLHLQTEFLIQRLEEALPKMLANASPGSREKVSAQFYRVARSGEVGAYALIDYVNFKGEGILETERYRSQGWGLLQVLENMPDPADARDPVQEFARSAKEILARRVRNAPPERHEERWLPGWQNRVAGYAAAGR